MRNGDSTALAATMTASLGVKLVVLLLEAREKRALLLSLYNNFSVESTSGLISRSSFWWLNSLLISGHRTMLTVADLPAIHEKLDSESLGNQLQSAWDKCEPLPPTSAPRKPTCSNHYRQSEQKACFGTCLRVELALGDACNLRPEALLRGAQHKPGVSHPECSDLRSRCRAHQQGEGVRLDRCLRHCIHRFCGKIWRAPLLLTLSEVSREFLLRIGRS